MSKEPNSDQSSDSSYSSDNREAYFNDPEYRKKLSKQQRILHGLYVAFLSFVVLIALSGLGTIIYLSQTLPSLEQLENPKPELATTVYSADGKLLSKYFLKNRTSVPLDSVSQHVIDALIATEDADFYDHWGFNSRRFVIAMIENVVTMRKQWHGASTITQQLARNLYLTLDRTVTRKIRELLTAIQIERRYTKNEILWLYLNTVYFGNGAWGIEAAAWTYFNKPSIQLTPDESALMISLLKSPRDYDPIKNPKNAKSRRDLILRLMAKANFISDQQAAAYAEKEITLDFTSVTDKGEAPYFIEYLRRKLKVESEKYGFDIYKDGLTIYTTLDTRMQAHAEKSVEEHLPWIQEQFDEEWRWPWKIRNAIIRETPRFKQMRKDGVTEKNALKTLKADKEWLDQILYEKSRVEVGFVAIEPSTGHIKAWVGGKDYKPEDYRYQFDHVWQAKRQPGSTFKPFVYTAAIDEGIPSNHQLLNQPLVIKTKERVWTPENSDKASGGMTTLRDALRNSLNQVTIRLVNESVTPSKIIEYARRMGIKAPLDENFSIALGTSAITPLELCSAYGTFANNGVHVEPISILRIEDKFGQPIVEYKPEKNKAIDPSTNYVMVSMLKSVVNAGTGIATRKRYKFYEEAGGKTGTTQNNKDAWFAGFTPQMAAVCWTGFDDERITYTSMKYGQGARASLPIWARYMKYCYDDPELNLKSRYFQRPGSVKGVPISKSTNLPAASGDQDAYVEYFTRKGWENYKNSLGDFQRFNRMDTLSGRKNTRFLNIGPRKPKRGEGEF